MRKLSVNLHQTYYSLKLGLSLLSRLIRYLNRVIGFYRDLYADACDQHVRYMLF